MTQACVSD